MTSVGRETSSQVDQQPGGPFDDTMPSRNCSAARPWCDWCEHTQSQPILISHLGSFPAQTPMPVAFISRLGSALRHVGRQPASSSPATPDSRSHRTPFPQPGLGANPKDINGTTPAASHFANSALRPTHHGQEGLNPVPSYARGSGSGSPSCASRYGSSSSVPFLRLSKDNLVTARASFTIHLVGKRSD